MQGRRLSYSQVVGQCRKGSGLTPLGKVRRPVPKQIQIRSLASLHKPSQDSSDAAGMGGAALPLPTEPKEPSTTAAASPVQWHPPSPAFEEEQPLDIEPAKQLAARRAAKKAAAKKGTKQKASLAGGGGMPYLPPHRSQQPTWGSKRLRAGVAAAATTRWSSEWPA